MTVHPEGVVTFGEAAAVLGVSTPVIRGLVAQGILHITAEYRNGFSKLLPAVDVQRFAEGYVATSVLAKRFHLDSGSLARYLKESGTQLLGVPLPDPGNYYAFFLRKDVAAQIQLPSRRMLREEAERRIKDARKENGQSTDWRERPPRVNPCDGNAGESSGSLPLLAFALRDGATCNRRVPRDLTGALNCGPKTSVNAARLIRPIVMPARR